MSSIEAREFSQAALDLTSGILLQNPEYYTTWNHRRRIHQAIWAPKPDDHSAIAEDIASELRFITPLMLKYPKCYWIWNYRVWLLEQSLVGVSKSRARAFWQDELGLVVKMLSRDRRNFHGWRYRRIVVAALESEQLSDDGHTPTLTEQEFEYTTKMICADLSNFSAWHYRSRLLPRLLNERNTSEQEQRQMLDEELNLIHEALIDPYDSSLWFYHQCLTASMSPTQAAQSIAPSLSQQERLQYIEGEIAYVKEMLDGSDDCKWVFRSLIELSRLYKSQSEKWPPEIQEANIRDWMSQLKKLDPLRRGRWQELEQ